MPFPRTHEGRERLRVVRAEVDGLPATGSDEGRRELRDCLDLGLYVGVTGWVCDERRGRELRDALDTLPLDRLLIETDAPYLLPRDLHPIPKGRRNEPRFLVHIAERVATFMNKPVEDVARATTENAEWLFGLHAQGQHRLLL